MTDFAGRTISGDISHYAGEQKTQDDPQLLLAALDKLLATPGVEAVRWSQYTPYFNDGDACVFNVYDAYVKIAGNAPDAGDYEDGYLGRYDLWDYERGYGSPKKFHNVGGHAGKPIHDALEKFETLLGSGRHDQVLREKFGDPAQVTATTAGFDVEFYDHE